MISLKRPTTHNTANEVFHCVHLECPAINHANADDDNNQVGLASKETNVPTSPSPSPETTNWPPLRTLPTKSWFVMVDS